VLMEALGRQYFRRFNLRYERTGTLWEGRYRASLVDSESYFLACMRYIELNPVRAGLVRHPRDYAWSSCAHHLDGRADALVTEHELYHRLAPSLQGRRAVYSELLGTPMNEGELATIRKAASQSRMLGGTEFCGAAVLRFGDRAVPVPRGRPRKSRPRQVVDSVSLPSKTSGRGGSRTLRG